MREILFRGQRTDNKEWVYGNLFIPDREDSPTEILIGTNVVRISYEVSPKTVGQYTGLEDKRGTKIFEGDIIAHGVSAKSVIEYGWAKFICHRLFKDGREFKSIDEYNEQEFMDLCNVYECEVIGNIYENHELLEVNNDNK